MECQQWSFEDVSCRDKSIFIACRIVRFCLFPRTPVWAEEVSIEQLQQEAEGGNVIAQFLLGFKYEQGNGVKQDYQKAKEWYEKSAEQGNRGSQFRLGFLYLVGNGVKQNYQNAK